MIYNEVLLTRQIPEGNANRHIFCAAGNNKKIISKTAAFRAKLWYLGLLPGKELIQWPRNAPTARAISAIGQMAAGRVATPQDTTRKPVSASSKTSSKCIFATKKHRKPKFSVLFGAAGRIRTADLILTQKPSCFLVSTHSCQGIPPNPLQRKWFGDFYFPSYVIFFSLILDRFIPSSHTSPCTWGCTGCAGW